MVTVKCSVIGEDFFPTLTGHIYQTNLGRKKKQTNYKTKETCSLWAIAQRKLFSMSHSPIIQNRTYHRTNFYHKLCTCQELVFVSEQKRNHCYVELDPCSTSLWWNEILGYYGQAVRMMSRRSLWLYTWQYKQFLYFSLLCVIS